MQNLYGTGVALVTPFDASGNIDFSGLHRVLEHTAQGVDYYVIMGTTGEAGTTTAKERNEVLDFVRKNNPKKLPIVFGIGGNNTAEVLESISHTDLTGISAILSVSPYYLKPSQEGIYQHFISIAGKSPVPVILYNVPGRTSSNMTAETTLRLAGYPGIAGIKEASGNLEQVMRIIKGKPTDFLVISGDDLLTAGFYAMGGVGVISVLANAYPLIFKKMKELGLGGNSRAAFCEQFRLLDINGPMYEEGSPVGVKELLSQLGICGPFVRQPHATASASLKAKIKAFREVIN